MSGSPAARPLSPGGTGSGAPSIGRLARGFSVALALAAAGLLTLAVGSASAVDIGHFYSFSFEGSGTNALVTPTTADVDNSGGLSAGSVYVADSGTHRVEKFDAAGNFLLMFGKGVNQTTGGDVCPVAPTDTCQPGATGTAAGQLTTPTFLAVDSSSGPSSGDVYVANTSNNTIDKYDSAGNLITTWGSGGMIDGSTATNGPFNSIAGIDVDSSGNLAVFNTSSRLFRFDQSGAFLNTFTEPRGTAASGLAVTPDGTQFYKADGAPAIQRFNASGSVQISSVEGTTGINVDSVTGTLYQVRSTQIAEYKFNGSGQPLNEDNSPCPATLELFGSGCPPTHSYGSGNLTGARGLGVNASTSRLYVADTGNHQIDVFLPALAPKVTTGEPISNSGVSGEVDPDGAGEVVECYFEFGLGTSYGSKENCTPAPPYISPQAVTAILPGLEGEKTYHYRLVAKNLSGAKNTGADKTITPHNVKGLKTEAATSVTRTTATLNASFEGNGEETFYYFEWGTTAGYGSKSLEEHVCCPTYPPLTPLHFDVTGLQPETTYHFHVVARNGAGISPGKDMTFTTLPAVPGLVTTAATEIGQDTVTLNGEFAGNGEDTHYYFEYGLTPKYGMLSEATDLTSPSGPTPVFAKITEYEGYETYHYRIVASNNVGTTHGNDETFTTEPAPLPEIVNTSASNVTDTSAMLEAEVNPNRWLTVYAFEYGPTTAYGSSTEVSSPIGSDKAMHPVSAVVGDLAPGTTYHFRAVAINFTGTVYGPDVMVTTPGPPRVDVAFSSGVGETTAHLGAKVSPTSSATKVRFEYGTSTSYGQSTGEVAIGSDTADHEVGADLSGLSAGTTYHFRVIATNGFGTTNGSDQTFVTAPATRITPPEERKKRKCRKGFVRRHGKCVKKPRKHRKHRRHSTRRQG